MTSGNNVSRAVLLRILDAIPIASFLIFGDWLQNMSNSMGFEGPCFTYGNDGD